MSTAGMAESTETSPRSLARMAGGFQLLEAVTATSGEVIILGKLVVAGNAASTAANILGHQRLFWLGFASSLIGVVSHLAWAFLFYELFKVVYRRLSLFAAFVILVGCAIQALTCLLYVAPLPILEGLSSFGAFTPQQLQGLALMTLKLNGYAFNIYLVFFGLWCALIGFLIFKSTFMPRVLGVLLAIAGLGWMLYLIPPVASRLFSPYIVAASAVGEIPLELWLLVFAVNEQRWKVQASAAGAST